MLPTVSEEELQDDGFGIVEEPSSYTCEQRGYGKFACSCGREWGSTFIRDFKLENKQFVAHGGRF